MCWFTPGADMVRNKLRVVQCDDEYMTGEYENTTKQDAESSNFQPLSCNGEEGFTESDDEEDEDDHDDTGDNAQAWENIFSIDDKNIYTCFLYLFLEHNYFGNLCVIR